MHTFNTRSPFSAKHHDCRTALPLMRCLRRTFVLLFTGCLTAFPTVAWALNDDYILYAAPSSVKEYGEDITLSIQYRGTGDASTTAHVFLDTKDICATALTFTAKKATCTLSAANVARWLSAGANNITLRDGNTNLAALSCTLQRRETSIGTVSPLQATVHKDATLNVPLQNGYWPDKDNAVVDVEVRQGTLSICHFKGPATIAQAGVAASLTVQVPRCRFVTSGTSMLTVAYTAQQTADSADILNADATKTVSFTVNTSALPAFTLSAPTVSPTAPSIGGRATFHTSVTAGTLPTAASVTFRSGTEDLCTSTFTNTAASCSVARMSGGTHAVIAVYQGNAQNAGATSDALSLRVAKAKPTLSQPAISPAQVQVGQEAQLTTTMNGGTNVQTTSPIQFIAGTQTLCTATGPSSGMGNVSCTWRPEKSDAYDIKAVYQGDAYNKGFRSPEKRHRVALRVTSLEAPTATPSSPAVAGSVTLGSTLNWGGTQAGVSLSRPAAFKEGDDTLCEASLTIASADTSKAFTCDATDGFAWPESHVVSVEFDGGSGQFAAATAVDTTVTVTGKARPVLTLTSTPSTSVALTQPVRYVATIAKGYKLPADAITMTDNDAAFSSGCTTSDVTTLSNSARTGYTYTCTTSYTEKGSHTIAATTTYAGTNAENTVPSAVSITLEVGKATPMLALSMTPSTGAVIGTPVTYTVTITNAFHPTTNLILRDGSTALTDCTPPANLTSFGYTRSCSTEYTSVGSTARSITARIAEGSNNNAGSAALSVTVKKATPVLEVTASPSEEAAPGQLVTYTATVSAGYTPPSTVVLKDNGTPLTTCTALSAQTQQGYAKSCTKRYTTAGAHTIIATLVENARNNAGREGVLNFTIGKASSTLTLTSQPEETVNVGQPVTLTAIVDDGFEPSTDVSFTDNDADLQAKCALSDSTAFGYTATCMTAFSPAGTHTVDAGLDGNSKNHPAPVATVKLQVEKASPTLTFTVHPPGPLLLNTPTTYTATVANGFHPPSPILTDNATPLTDCTTTANAGMTGYTYACTTRYTEVGLRSVTAGLPEEANNTPPANVSLNIQVLGTKSALSLQSSSVKPGESTSLMATLSGDNPSGDITFSLSLANADTAVTLCAPAKVPLSGTGNTKTAECTLTATGKTGRYTMTAQYPGDTKNTPATATATLTVETPPAGPQNGAGTAGGCGCTTSTEASALLLLAMLFLGRRRHAMTSPVKNHRA